MRISYRLFVIAAFISASILMLAGCIFMAEPDERVSQISVAAEPEETPGLPSPTRTQATSAPVPTESSSTMPTESQQPETNIAVFYIDLNDDGVDEEIIVSSVDDDGYGGDIIIEVSGNGETNQAVVDWGYPMSALMAQTQSGDPCVLISADYASDDYWTRAVSFDGMAPVVHEELYGYAATVSGNEVVISSVADVLGSWSCHQRFELLDDFSLQPVTDRQIIIGELREPLVNIRELPVEMLEEGVYKEKTLDIGTAIYPVSTDGKTYLNFRLADDSQGRINFTRDAEHYWLLIDGLSEDEYFEGLEYWD